MNRRNFINRGQRLSPSARSIIKLRKRAFSTGGASLELQIPTNYIRDISRDLNYDITSDASLIMTPNTIGEGRLFNCKPVLNNLLIRSEEFDNATWIKAGVNVTTNATTDPNGNNTGSLLDATLSNSFVRQNFTALTNTSYTFSVYLKSVSGTIGLNILLTNNNGTVVVASQSVTATTTWIRYSVTGSFSSLSSSQSVFIGGSSTFTPGEQVYAWGAQLEQGSTATAYQRTTDGITDFQATRATTATVIQKDGSIGEACYNLKANSEDLSNATWVTKTNSTITTNQTNDPNGSLTADLVSNSNTANTFNQVGASFSLEIGSYNSSFYYKNNTLASSVVVEVTAFVSSVNKASLIVNSNTLSVVSSQGLGNFTLNSYSIQTLPNGWNRLSISYSLNSAQTVSSRVVMTDLAANIGSCYIWGGQLSKGGLLKDYLKTTNRLAVPSIDYGLGSSLPALLVEPQRTNIVFPSATATTQSRTVTAQPYTLSFYGTGTVDLTGTHTDTVVGLGATTLKTYTFTPTAGSLTFTITGTVTDWQCEAGSNYTSRIVTTSAAATRNNYTSFVDLQNNSALNKDNFTLFVEGYIRYGDTTNISFGLSDTTATGARANDIGFFDGIKATYAVGSTITSDTTNISNENYYKFAIQRSGTSVKFFRNGAQIWTTQTIAVFDYRYLILNTGGSTFMVQKVALWKTTKSDSDCITLTT